MINKNNIRGIIMDDKVIKVEGNLLRLYASLLPNIVKLLDMDDMKELDIRKSSVHNYMLPRDMLCL